MTVRVGAAHAHKLPSDPSSPQSIAKAFDQTFKWSTETHALNGNNDDIKLGNTVSGASLPGEAGKIFANVTKASNFKFLSAHQLTIGGQKVYALLGTDAKPISYAGLALFNARGKELAFKDLMGLNQWQFDAKNAAHNDALAQGLAGAAHPKPVKPLSPAAQKITAAFDKAFPFDENTDSVTIPDKFAFNGTLPKGSQAARMAHNSLYDDGANTQTYKMSLAGKPVYVVIGQTDAVYDIGIFDMAGKKIGINPDGNWYA